MTEDFKRTRKFPTNEAILETIKHLRDLEARTDPCSESTKWLVSAPDIDPALADTPIGKDGDAASALTHAAILFDQLAGWAVDHVAGRILENVPTAPPFIHAAPTTEENPDNPADPELVKAERKASDPSHEARGATYEFGVTKYDRPLFAELLTQMAPAFPPGLAFEASHGLYALSLNEGSPLYERWSSGTKWRKEYAKQYALLYLAFHTARIGPVQRGKREGTREDTATVIQKEIAKAYRFEDISQIRHWRTSGRQKFRAEFGLGGLEYRLLDAEEGGAKVRAWERLTVKAKEQTDQHDRRVVEHYERLYGEDRLAYYGDLYKPPKKRT